MADRRLMAANHRHCLQEVAAAHPQLRVVPGVPHRIVTSLADLLSRPDGRIDRQLLFGEGFEVIDGEPLPGWVFGRRMKDGYCGYLRRAALGTLATPTYRVTAPRGSHIYGEGNVKARVHLALPYGALLACDGAQGEGMAPFQALSTGGYVPAGHMAPLTRESAAPCEDLGAAVCLEAEGYLGVPYLWGGDSIWGIDCSGLVQRSFEALGFKGVARDSDQQHAGVGREIARDEGLFAGDLVFWPGHVGIIVSAGRARQVEIIHANAHHMRVTRETLVEVEARVRAREGQEISAFKRVVGYV